MAPSFIRAESAEEILDQMPTSVDPREQWEWLRDQVEKGRKECEALARAMDAYAEVADSLWPRVQLWDQVETHLKEKEKTTTIGASDTASAISPLTTSTRFEAQSRARSNTESSPTNGLEHMNLAEHMEPELGGNNEPNPHPSTDTSNHNQSKVDNGSSPGYASRPRSNQTQEGYDGKTDFQSATPALGPGTATSHHTSGPPKGGHTGSQRAQRATSAPKRRQKPRTHVTIADDEKPSPGSVISSPPRGKQSNARKQQPPATSSQTTQSLPTKDEINMNRFRRSQLPDHVELLEYLE